jgi:hypothetical protein
MHSTNLSAIHLRPLRLTITLTRKVAKMTAAGESFDSGMFDLGWIKPKPKKFSKSNLLWLIGGLVALIAVAFVCL